MELKTYFAQDAAGNIISSAVVNVFLQGTNTLATGLTRADGTPLDNPFAADGAGRIQFRAPDGYYDVQVSAGSGIIQTLTIQCVDYSGAKADADRAEAAAARSASSAEQATDIVAAVITFSGELTPVPELTAVPKHSNPDIGEELDAQAQALLNRQERNRVETYANTSAIAATNARVDNIIASQDPTEGNSELVDIRVTSSGKILLTAGDAARFQSYTYNKAVYPVTVETKYYLNEAGYKQAHSTLDYSYAELVLPAGEYYLETRVDQAQRGLRVNGKTYPAVTGMLPAQDFRATFRLYDTTTVAISSMPGAAPLLYSVANLEVDPGFKAITSFVPVDGYYINSSGVPSQNSSWSYFDWPVQAGETYLVEGSIVMDGKLTYIDKQSYPVGTVATKGIYRNTVTAKTDGILRVSYLTAHGVVLKQAAANADMKPITDLLRHNGKTDHPLSIETGFYLSESGAKKSIANSSFSYADLTLPAGDYLLEAKVSLGQRALKLQGKVYPEATGSLPLQEYKTSFRLFESAVVAVSSCDGVPPRLWRGNIADDRADFTALTGLSPVAGSYVTKTGAIKTNNALSYLEIPVKFGDVYFIQGRVLGDAKLYYSEGEYLPVADQASFTLVSDTLSIKDDGVLQISYETAYGLVLTQYNPQKILSDTLVYLNNRVEAVENNYPRAMHRKTLALGDSLTSGANYQPPQTGQSIEECYPYYLNLISRWVVTNAGFSGITALGMWNSHIKNSEFIGSDYDSCVMWLGTNGGLTDTLAADTASGSYLTYADTNTGRYCSIIEKMLVENPKLKFYLIKVFAVQSGGVLATTNAVLDQIGAKYGVPVFDINQYGAVYPAPTLHTANALHFDKIGNAVVADEIYRRVVVHIRENLSDYNPVLLGQRVTTIFDN